MSRSSKKQIPFEKKLEKRFKKQKKTKRKKFKDFIKEKNE